MSDMDEVFGLFPTPFLRAPGTLSAPLVEGLVRHFSALAQDANKASDNLSHTAMLRPGDSELFVEAATLITPKIVDMKGMGAKKEALILKALEEQRRFVGRRLTAEAHDTAAGLVAALRGHAPEAEIHMHVHLPIENPSAGRHETLSPEPQS